MHIPILGICLGHQIIGLLHGAEIFREKYIEKMEEIKVIEKNILFAGIAQSTYFQEAHSEYITLPEGFVHLARSASCENEAMKHPSKNIFGTQFHPEISGENGAMIFRNFLGICV